MLKKKSAFTITDDNNIRIFKTLCGSKVPIWLLVNDCSISDSTIQFKFGNYNEYYDQISLIWNNYMKINDNLISKKGFNSSICGYNSTKDIFYQTQAGKDLVKISTACLLDKISNTNLENHKIYIDWYSFWYVLKTVWNLVVNAYYKMKGLLLEEQDDITHRKTLDKSYYSHKLYDLFIKIGMSKEEALSAAQEFMDEMKKDIELEERIINE